jgi:hypothetical protein
MASLEALNARLSDRSQLDGGTCTELECLLKILIKTRSNGGFPGIQGLQFPAGVKECR